MLDRFQTFFAVALLSAAFTGTAPAAAAGTLSLSGANFTVAQQAGSLQIGIARSGGSSGAVETWYNTRAVTAVDGGDYTNTWGHVQWAAGESDTKTIIIPISTQRAFSGTKTLSFVLSSPSGGVSLGSPSSAGITINGSAGSGSGSTAGTIALSSSSYSVPQTAKTVTVVVNRSGGGSGAVSVTHTTTNGTAVAGQNFVATTGTLSWAQGDTSAKSFTVPISSTTPYSGSKTFTVALTNPSGGAALGMGSAGVAITGVASGTGSNGSAPGSLLMTSQNASSIGLSWSAAPGSVSYYKIYRNNSEYATTQATSYIDYGANGATNGAFTSAANIYSYAVSAVNAQGVESQKTSLTSFEVYRNGIFYWAGDYSYSASINYRDTSGGPESGPYDIAVRVTQQGGGFQPYAGDTVPVYDLEAGAFEFITLDLKPTVSGQSWRLSMISRLPPGDVYPWSAVNLADYGAQPVAGKWATYKVPLAALSVGKTSFQGSISGNTLRVSGVNWGVGVDAGGFVTGAGVQPGTYITGYGAQGGPGTYTVSPSQNVGSTTMTEQRTGVYKFDIIDETGRSSNLYYVDNVAFTSN